MKLSSLAMLAAITTLWPTAAQAANVHFPMVENRHSGNSASAQHIQRRVFRRRINEVDGHAGRA